MNTALVVTLIGVVLTFFGMAGSALWKLSSHLATLVGEVKLIRALMKKSEDRLDLIVEDVELTRSEMYELKTSLAIMKARSEG